MPDIQHNNDMLAAPTALVGQNIIFGANIARIAGTQSAMPLSDFDQPMIKLQQRGRLSRKAGDIVDAKIGVNRKPWLTVSESGVRQSVPL